MNDRHRLAASQLLLALWAGAVLFFMTQVTPALFQAYAPDQAAKSVRIMLPKLDATGMTLLILTLMLSFRMSRARTILLVMALCLVIVSGFVLTPKMAELRALANDQMSLLPTDNPLRAEFRKLHGFSSGFMLLELLLGLSAIVVGHLAKPREEVSSSTSGP